MKKLTLLLVIALIFASCEKQQLNEYVAQPTTKAAVTLTTQTVQLSEGWNGISFYIEADEMDAEAVFNQIADKLTILKTTQQDGNSGVLWYLSSGNINTIGDLNCKYGYQLHVTEDCTLELTGNVTTDTVINITDYEGWRMCGVPFDHGKKVTDVYVFPNPAGQYDIAKHIPSGLCYWPAININQIVNLQPGSAYFVNYRQQKGEDLDMLTEIMSSKNAVIHCYYDKFGSECGKENAFVEVQDSGVTFKTEK